MQAMYFVLPEIKEIPSGGNLYNAHLISALRDQGQALECMTFEAFEEAWHHGQNGFYWLDTLFMDRLQWLSSEPPHPEMKLGLIVHHLNSLYPPEGISCLQYFEEKERAILNLFSFFLLSSVFTEKYLRKKGYDSANMITAPPALLFSPRVNQISPQEIQALMVSNLVNRKGILEFLQALSTVIGSMGPFSLTIVGSSELEPDYATECMRWVQENPLLKQCIHFTGACNAKKAHSYYSKANLFISTAKMETFGMALAEARSHKLPILALDKGNAGFHVLEGQNGHLYQEMNALIQDLKKLSLTNDRFIRLYESSKNSPYSTDHSWSDIAITLTKRLSLVKWM